MAVDSNNSSNDAEAKIDDDDDDGTEMPTPKGSPKQVFGRMNPTVSCRSGTETNVHRLSFLCLRPEGKEPKDQERDIPSCAKQIQMNKATPRTTVTERTKQQQHYATRNLRGWTTMATAAVSRFGNGSLVARDLNGTLENSPTVPKDTARVEPVVRQKGSL